MSKIIEFSELLVSKLCHDIAGQITAINNGIEFIQEDQPEIKNKALELVSSSVTELIAKYNFFKYAYGITKSIGEADTEQISLLMQEYFKFLKIKIIWTQNSDTLLNGLTHKACKLLVNLAIITSSSLIHGGTIEVKLEKGQYGKIIRVIGKGDDIKVNNENDAILIEHEQHEIKPSNVQVHLTAKIASSLGTIVQSSHSNNQLNYFVELSKPLDAIEV
jgi:histidine phosphotransferase ChpT